MRQSRCSTGKKRVCSNNKQRQRPAMAAVRRVHRAAIREISQNYLNRERPRVTRHTLQYYIILLEVNVQIVFFFLGCPHVRINLFDYYC